LIKREEQLIKTMIANRTYNRIEKAINIREKEIKNTKIYT